MSQEWRDQYDPAKARARLERDSEKADPLRRMIEAIRVEPMMPTDALALVGPPLDVDGQPQIVVVRGLEI